MLYDGKANNRKTKKIKKNSEASDTSDLLHFKAERQMFAKNIYSRSYFLLTSSNANLTFEIRP